MVPAQTYQSEVVSAYLSSSSNLIPPLNLFNSKGRAYPDVALMGYGYEVYANSRVSYECGTSASAPVFAAMIAIINSRRKSMGLSSVGFINPALYSIATNANFSSVFNDIIVGENNCPSGSGKVCCEYGFYAAHGWDPVTGLGSVNFENLAIALGANSYVIDDSSFSWNIVIYICCGATFIAITIGIFIWYKYYRPTRIFDSAYYRPLQENPTRKVGDIRIESTTQNMTENNVLVHPLYNPVVNKNGYRSFN